jgi:DNA-binding response OmpR family regulator
LALANKVPESSFAFDGVLGLPLNAKEVTAVINRLATKSTEHLLNHGPITLNMALRTVMTPNGQYTMTPKQCALLKLLMSEQGHVVERRKIMETVWETDYLEDTRTLDVHIRWLRERIEQNPSKPVYLKTVRGVGYRFDIPNG